MTSHVKSPAGLTQPRDRTAAPALGAGRLWAVGTVYVGGVVCAGAFTIAVALVELASGAVPVIWVPLAALTLFAGLFVIRIPSLCATLSVFDVVIFALILLLGPAPAIAAVALDGFIASSRLRRRSVKRTLFNVAEPAVSVWVSGTVFYGLSGVPPLLGQPVTVDTVFPALAALPATYFVVNALLTMVAVRLETGLTWSEFLGKNRPHLLLNYVVNVCVLVIIVGNTGQMQSMRAPAAVFALALLILSYVVSRKFIARIEGGNRPLAQSSGL